MAKSASALTTLYRGTMYEGFLQDQWRARSNLVIEAGLRYSLMNPYYAIWGNLDVFSPSSYNPANAVDGEIQPAIS